MAENTHLVFAFFENEEKADEAARELEAWARSSRNIDLDAIGVLVRDEFGAVNTQKLGPRAGKRGAGIGLVLGLIAAVPTGGLSLVGGVAAGAGGGGLVGSLVHRGLGLSEQDTAWMAGQLDAGRAAVGVLAAEEEADAVKGKLVGLGGDTKVHEVQDRGLEEAMAEDTAKGESSEPTQKP